MKKKMIFLCIAAIFMTMNVFAQTATPESIQEFGGDIREMIEEPADFSGRTEEAQTTLTINEPSPRMDPGEATRLATGASSAFIIFSLLFYVYSALCLQRIAKKTSQEPAWLAWVPIGNLFLMCKIGSLSYLWLIGILLSFLPLVGVFFAIGLCAYMWYRIALALHKPGWIGVLVCLPLANLVVIGYLAFSE